MKNWQSVVSRFIVEQHLFQQIVTSRFRERGLLPGNGSLTSVLAVATGKKPTFIGKPEEIIVNEALKLVGTKRADTLLVGDNYDTDIKAWYSCRY